MISPYSPDAPAPDGVQSLEGPVVLDFGTNWCGYCRAAEPLVAEALEQQPDVRHIRIEDGQGRRLGRSFGVKLWPTLVFLKDGREVTRLVRPSDAGSINQAVRALTGG